MTAYVAMPDAEAVVTTAIRAGVVPPVSTTIPHDAEAPYVAVRRIGGAPVERHRLDAPEVQVDVYGPNKAESHDLAQAVRVAIHEAEGTTVTYSDGAANVHGVDDAMGIAWLADPTTKRDRFTFTVRLYLSAA